MIRMERLEQDVRLALSKIISEELKNPAVTGLISVTTVKITPDEKYAKVYVSVYNSKSKKKTVEALTKAAKFIRGSLSRKVKMRNTPELTFVLDDSLEYGSYMDKVINELSKNNFKSDETK